MLKDFFKHFVPVFLEYTTSRAVFLGTCLVCYIILQKKKKFHVETNFVVPLYKIFKRATSTGHASLQVPTLSPSPLFLKLAKRIKIHTIQGVRTNLHPVQRQSR